MTRDNFSPKIGETYFTIAKYCSCPWKVCEFTFKNSFEDKVRIDRGGCYKTREEADAKCQKIEEMRNNGDLAGVLSVEYGLDFSPEDKKWINL
jgi:hypothetical protein